MISSPFKAIFTEKNNVLDSLTVCSKYALYAAAGAFFVF